MNVEVERGEGNGLAVGILCGGLLSRFDGGLGCGWTNFRGGLAVFVGGAREDDLASGGAL